ncbi:toll-like receptor 7 [Watersipora subatra]|uniref:toll-like receptor 7 n=1 Tax=Watersipora subatra TaxID=2589382 RepID=UPI00355B667D
MWMGILKPSLWLLFLIFRLSCAENGQKLCETDQRLCFTGICKVKECQKCTNDAFCTTSNPDKIVPQGLQLKTSSLDLTYNGPDAELTENMMAYLGHLKFVTIRGNIRSLAPSTFFNQPYMQQLTITDSKLSSLPDQLFGNNNRLRYLELPNNRFTEIPSNIFLQIPNIQRLDFSNNLLEDCKNATIAPEFSNLTKLNDVRLGGYGQTCGAEICRNLSQDHFLPIQHIGMLDLTSSLVFLGNQRILEPLTKLTSLTIGDVSPYKECPASAKELFENLPPKLTTLTFQNWATTDTVNNSCFLTNESLSGLKQLERLSTFDCRYSDKIFGNTLHSSVFQGFPRLKLIYLHWCGLALVETGAFNAVDKASNIGLSGNMLGARALKLFTSNQTSRLKSLSLKGVGIGAALYEAYYLIDAFPELQNLYLDDNYLNYVPDFGFTKNLTSPVTTLTLNNNEIKSFSAGDGQQLCTVMPNLLHFQAELNEITDLSGLVYCSNLKQLTLANNKIGKNEESNFEAIGQLHNLEHLDLSSNKIKHIGSNLLGNLKLLQTLILANNDIANLPDMVFMTTPLLASLDLSDNGVTVLKPVTLSNGLSKLRNLYLQANQITTLSPTLLNVFDTKITKLKYFGILANPLICSCDEIFSDWVRNSSFIIQATNLNCRTPENSEVSTQVISYKPNRFFCYVKEPLIISGIVLGCVILSLAIGIPCYRYRWYLRHPQVVTRAVKDRLRELEFEQKCQYDAFISYDASNDSDSNWVMRQLIPAIETVAAEGNQVRRNRSLNIKCMLDFNAGSDYIAMFKCCLLSTYLSTKCKKLKLYIVDRDSAAGSLKHTEQCRAIEASRKIIVLLSNSYLANPSCLTEADLLASYELVEGEHCYQPNRMLIILLEELNEEVLKAPVTSMLTQNVIHVVGSEANMGRVWKRVKRFVAKPRYIYRKKKKFVSQEEASFDEHVTEEEPLIQYKSLKSLSYLAALYQYGYFL